MPVAVAQVELNLVSDMLLFLLRRRRGRAGRRALAPALIAGRSAGSLLLNYYFTPPLHTFTIGEPNNALALLVFVAGRDRWSARSSTWPPGAPGRPPGRAAEARTLATLAGSVLRGERGAARAAANGCARRSA